MYAAARPAITDLLLHRLEGNKKNLDNIKRLADNMTKEPLTGIALANNANKQTERTG